MDEITEFYCYQRSRQVLLISDVTNVDHLACHSILVIRSSQAISLVNMELVCNVLEAVPALPDDGGRDSLRNISN
jgi:hypothetical protein